MSIIVRPTQEIYQSIVFALDQPPHVQIAEMMILPVNRY